MLVTQSALDDPVRAQPVGVVAIVAARVAGDVGVGRVDQLGAGVRGVAVVGAVDGFFGAGRAFFVGSFHEAVLHFRRREQEVLVREVDRQFLRRDEALELADDLFVAEADCRLFAAVGGIGVGVEQGAAEARAIAREFTAAVVVLARDRVDVPSRAAVVREVAEVLIDPTLIVGRIRRGSGGIPVDGVVRVRRHHGTAVVVQVCEQLIE